MPSNEEVVNEYLLDAYGMKKIQVENLEETVAQAHRQFVELAERYETTLHTYADVCKRNDKMQAAGDVMRDLLIELVVLSDKRVEKAIEDWGNANV